MHKRACLNYHIHSALHHASATLPAEQYEEQVQKARSFLNGNYRANNRALKHSNARRPHQANSTKKPLNLRNQIASIRLLTEHQIVDKERRFDQDVMVFRQVGEKMLAVADGCAQRRTSGQKRVQC